MQEINGKAVFYAKILLFGEYSVILGGQALAIPYPQYKGYFSFAVHEQNAQTTSSNQSLQKLAHYISTKTKEGLLQDFRLNAFQKDIEKKLYFWSDIPQGYGLGSSGALVAALYDRYIEQKKMMQSLKSSTKNATLHQELKNSLAQIESCFHGKSSGFDPLVCLVNLPILQNESGIQAIQIPTQTTSSYNLFLYNTRKKRKTEPLVNFFLNKCSNELFTQSCKQYLVKYNNNCITALLEANSQLLWNNFDAISQFQWVHFQKMIPDSIKEVWHKGLQSSNYRLKLCGAGGGGFMIGISSDWHVTQHLLGVNTLQQINV